METRPHDPRRPGRLSRAAAGLGVVMLAGVGLTVTAGPASADVTSLGRDGDTFTFTCAPSISGGNWVLKEAGYNLYDAVARAGLNGAFGVQDRYSVDLSSLPAGTYRAWVRCDYVAAWDGSGLARRTAESSFGYAGVQKAPSAVRNLAAAAGPATVTLSWDAPEAPGSEMVTYEVRSADGAVWTTDDRTFTAQDLRNGTAYTYTVTARNSVGDSAPQTVTATPVAPVPTATLELDSNFRLGTDNSFMATVMLDGRPVEGWVKLQVDGEDWGRGEVLTNGRAWFSSTTPFRAGDYVYTLVYEGSDEAAPTTVDKTFTVEPLETQVSVGIPWEAKAGEPLEVSVHASGQGMRVDDPEGVIEVVLDGPDGQRVTASTELGWGDRGQGTVTVPALTAGQWTVTGRYVPSVEQNAYRETTSQSRTFTVSPAAPVAVDVTVPGTVTAAVGSPVRIPVELPAAPAPRPASLSVLDGDREIRVVDVPADGPVVLDLGVLTPGTHELVVTSPADERVEASTRSVVVTVDGEPVADPSAPAAELAASAPAVHPGATLDLVVGDLVPGETVAFYLHPEATLVGTAVVDASGVATLQVVVPEGTPLGEHHVRATGGSSGRTAEVALSVVAPPADGDGPLTPPADGDGPLAPPADGDGPAAPPADHGAPASPVADGASPAATGGAAARPTAAGTPARALATTGSDAGALVALQAALVAGGAGLLALRRKLSARA